MIRVKPGSVQLVLITVFMLLGGTQNCWANETNQSNMDEETTISIGHYSIGDDFENLATSSSVGC